MLSVQQGLWLTITVVLKSLMRRLSVLEKVDLVLSSLQPDQSTWILKDIKNISMHLLLQRNLSLLKFQSLQGTTIARKKKPRTKGSFHVKSDATRTEYFGSDINVKFEAASSFIKGTLLINVLIVFNMVEGKDYSKLEKVDHENLADFAKMDPSKIGEQYN